GTVITGLILISLRVVNARLPDRTLADVEVRWRRDAPSPEAEVEAALRAVDPAPATDRFELIDDGAVVRRSWRVRIEGEPQLKTLAAQLSAMPSVCGYVLDPRDD